MTEDSNAVRSPILDVLVEYWQYSADRPPGIIEEATAGYEASFKGCVLDIIHWSEGLFGFVAELDPLLEAFAPKIAEMEAKQEASSFNGDLGLSNLQKAYCKGLSPNSVIEDILTRIEKYSKIDPAVWIHRVPKESLVQRVNELEARWPDPCHRPPLFGVPFGVKDNMDIAGLPTTTACPPLTRVPSQTARVCEIILSQGGILVGKTNMDQLATGLTGCRSPFGIPRSVFHHDYIAGGSSSGSCVTVGAGLVSFALGTDTGGSGRVPAGFNGVVGYKPTKGLISTQGVTAACMSLDSIAIIANNVQDARTVWDLSMAYDEADAYARISAPMQRHINSIGPQATSFRFGVPPPETLGICSPDYRRLFDEAVQALKGLGGQVCQIDRTPFEKAGKLLYERTFVCERLANLPDDWLDRHLSVLHPVTESIFSKALSSGRSAVDAFRDLQSQALYTRQVEKIFEYTATGVDVVVVPTAPIHWTVDEVLKDPIATNSALGEFSYCANIVDLCAIAVPAGFYNAESLGDADVRLPFSVTFLGGTRMDAELLQIADRYFHAIKSN